MSEIDQEYYRETTPGSAAEKLLVRARDCIYRDLERVCSPSATSTILDFGVSDVVNDGANLLERLYPHPQNITAVGLGIGTAFQQAFPTVTYVQTKPYQPLPFQNRSFDIAVSNAVLEHMGARHDQEWMIAELARVATSVFVTVPNRYFPIEHHTALPLVHYNESLFSWICALTGKEMWALEQNLILMSKRKLRILAPENRTIDIGYTGLKLGPFSSNLYMYIAK